MTLSQERLLAFIQKNLEQGLAPFVGQEADGKLKDKIQGVVRGHLERIAQDLGPTSKVPQMEAYMKEPGVVAFRFLGPLDPALHMALYEAGLVDQPPLSIVCTFTVEPSQEG